MSDSFEKGRLLELLKINDQAPWSILDELAKKQEDELRAILRPHDDVGFSASRDQASMRLRERLDLALGALTIIEIACELGLIDSTDLIEIQAGSLRPLCNSAAFLRYLEAYLYFGVRLLAGRLFPPNWWSDKPESCCREEIENRRCLPLAVPPTIGETVANAAIFTRFLELQESERQSDSSSSERAVNDALEFLDGFYATKKRHGAEDCDEPAEFELWLRGLGPEIDGDHRARFSKIRTGLAAWVRSHGNFYLGLETDALIASDSRVLNLSERPPGGWIVTNPTAARFALADFYWIARLLRSEVSGGARVTYPRSSWMHLLRFRAILDRELSLGDELLGYEELIRSVFDFVCDLVQNAMELSEQRERRFFQPREYPRPQGTNKQWREVFDDELREIDSERSMRTYSTPKMPQSPSTTVASGTNDRTGGQRQDWSERLISGKEPRNLVGLAFSGGGIRSATFNLGVLQGLQELDLLRHFDYISTVSGGGFIGSWLAGNVRRTKHWLGKATCWDESIAHLRSYSNYLAPRTGFLSPDTWTLAGSWVRNASLVQITGLTWLFAVLLAPLVGLVAFQALSSSYPSQGMEIGVITTSIAGRCFSIASATSYVGLLSAALAILVTGSLAYNFLDNRVVTGKKSPRSNLVRLTTVIPSWMGAFIVASLFHSVVNSNQVLCLQSGDLLSYSSILSNAFRIFPFLFVLHWVALVIIGWIVLTPTATEPLAKPVRFRRIVGLVPAVFIGALCMAALYVEVCAILYLFAKWNIQGTSFCTLAFVFGPPLVLTAFTMSVVLFIGFTGRNTNEAQREWWTRFGAWLSLYGTGSLALACASTMGPFLLFWIFSHAKGWAAVIPWSAVAAWIGTVIGGLFAGKSSRTSGEGSNGKSLGLQILAKSGGLLFIVGLALLAASALHLFLLYTSTTLKDVGQKWASYPGSYWDVIDALKPSSLLLGLAVTAGIGLLFSWYFEINIFGLNQFYRNRLVRCYLGATRWMPGMRSAHPFTKFDFNDDMLLSDLRGEYPGPLPILNCALNLAGSSDLALNTRHSASFSLTPLHCGADRPKVGYSRTGPTATDPNCFAGGVMLGQAVSISGAAASPNMGYNTSPLVAFLLTMFNVRLGWWFPNPARWAWDAKGLRFSLYYLTRELLGSADETRMFLNVSDGGHFENLGIYELIRRRCKVIIASDAECDELLQFGGLGNMLRICETDFGAIIDIDIRSIREQKEGRSQAHCAVGKIKYDNGSLGYLIYLKASMSGDEEVGVAQYKTAHPSFPHETTANQFFTEDQFESYRKLGQHVVRHSFRGAQAGDSPIEVAERLADVIAPAGCSTDSFLKHTKTLERLWGELRKAPALHSFLDELMRIQPPVATALAPPASYIQSSQEHAMGLELLQLMEDVFMDLRLDDFWEHPDNRGWAIMFMRWARSPRFQNIWNQTHRTYGIRFEYFCAARLGLTRDNPIARV